MGSKPLQSIKNESRATKGELNYLLIAPRHSLLPYPQNQENPGSALPPIPMGLAYVSATMKAAYRSVYNLNLEFEAQGVFEAIANAIDKHRIDVVLTGGMAGQFTKIKQVVDSVKKINKDIIVVAGGGVITPVPDVAMRALECVDIGILAEGEITARELVMALNYGGDLKKVNGLIYKAEDEFVLTPPREEISDLDALPLPDYEGIGCDKIFRSKKTAFVVSSRSCPFNCTFCYQSCGGKYRIRSIDNIISEIALLVENYQISSVGFIDELFVSNRKRVEEFCTKIKPYNISWGATVHATTFQGDLLPLMRESGCNCLNIGVESASDKVLKSMNKRTTSRQVESALEKIREGRIGTMGSIIFGDIAEDSETVEETIQWWRKNRQYSIELTRLYVYPGSPIYDHAVKHGLITDEVEHLRNDCREANVSKLTNRQYSEMLLRLTTEEAFYSYPPESFSILSVNIDDQRTLAKYTCSCGYEGKLWTNGLLLSNSFRCPECLQGYRLPYHEKYSLPQVRERIKSLITGDGKLAFWGLGREMQLLLKGIEVSSLEGIFVIDRDVKKQGLQFMGINVFAPSILQTENIAIVIPTPLLEAGIHYNESIAMEVSKISKAEVLPFGELLKENAISAAKAL